MMRASVRVSLLALLLSAVAVPASAQIVHSINFGAGFLQPRGFDGRVVGDVLVANLTRPELPSYPGNTDSLDFDFDRFGPHSADINKFRAMPVFFEWNMGFTRHLEVSVGAAFVNRRVSSVYRDLVDSHGTATESDDTEILQDIRLQTFPLSGVVRYVFGPQTGVQGFVGGGAAAVVYRYSEVGQFVDPIDLSVFNGNFRTNGVAPGGLLLGGARFGLGGDVFAITTEARYQWATGKTPGAPDFVGDKIDLSNWSLNFGFLIRF